MVHCRRYYLIWLTYLYTFIAGQLMSLLFEDLFKRYNLKVKQSIDKMASRKNKAREYNPLKNFAMHAEIISGGFVQAMSSGVWNLTRFRMKKIGVTENLSRLSFIAALGHVTRIRSHVEKSRKISGPRALQPSQWGLVCPSDTPEGEQCGLVKSLALLAHVTT